MNVLIAPSILKGRVDCPPSKSLTHRALIAAALAGGGIIENPLIAEDTLRTAECLRRMGFCFEQKDNNIIFGRNTLKAGNIYKAGASASTLRFLLPLLSLHCPAYRIYGSRRLMERIYTDNFEDIHGLRVIKGKDCLHVSGKITPGIFYLSGKKTTQLITGMILALPFLPHSKLILRDTDVYNPYIAMSLAVGRHFGIEYCLTDDSVAVAAPSMYKPAEYHVEGDFSNGAAWLAAAVFNPELTVGGLNPSSAQGDRSFFRHMEGLGVAFGLYDGCYRYERGILGAGEIDIGETPDLGPLLAALAGVGTGEVVLKGADNLRWKESDRAAAICEAIGAMGGVISNCGHTLRIRGAGMLKGGVTVDGANDHRVVMALSVIANRVQKPYVITGAEAINKSYGDFFKHYKKAGGKIEIL